jgi:hypothetical protein
VSQASSLSRRYMSDFPSGMRNAKAHAELHEHLAAKTRPRARINRPTGTQPKRLPITPSVLAEFLTFHIS